MARIPLYFSKRTTLVKPWVKGFRGSRRNPHAIQFLRIDPGWESPNASGVGGASDAPAYLPPELPPPGPFREGSAP